MNKYVLLACSIAVSLMMLSGAAAADEERRNGPQTKNSIIGTWQVEVTVRFDGPDCTSAIPVPSQPNPFPGLSTFHAGGTMSETGSRSPPSLRSPGHGVWRHIRNDKFQYRVTFQGFDVGGLLATNMDIRSDVTLGQDGKSFSAVARFAFSDISGNVTPLCATMEGVRFSL
jgi:hypothetical protein